MSKETYVPCEQDGGVARQSCALREGHKGACLYKIDPSGPKGMDTEPDAASIIKDLEDQLEAAAAESEHRFYALTDLRQEVFDLRAELHEARKLGERIVSLAQIAKRTLEI